MEPTDEILTVDDVMARLGIGRETVLRAIRRSELKAKKFGNLRGYRIRLEDYRAWIATPTPQKGDQQ